MNETENKKPQLSISKWAKVSYWSVLWGWGIGLILVIIVLFISMITSIGYDKVHQVVKVLGICTIIFNIIAAVSGVVALIWITINRRKLGGIEKAIEGFCFGTAYIVLVYIVLIQILIPTLKDMRFHQQRLMCEDNLRILGIAISQYGIEHNRKYPSPDKWCDLIINDLNNNTDFFKCPTCKQYRSSYAMNPYCEPNSPADMVLLFETHDGWNQHGGPEIFTFDHHKNDINSAIVLRNDGDIEVINSYDDISKLKWKAEANKVNQPGSR
jgi:hypothetical protein